MWYFGPFKVITKMDTVAYKLKLPNTTKIHEVLHVSQSKAFYGASTNPYLPLTLTTIEMGPFMMPIIIMCV